MTVLGNFVHFARHAETAHFAFAVVVALVLGLAALWGAFHFLKRKRIIEDTPTALVRSAPQGHVELQGQAELMDGDPIFAPLSLKHCVWFRYKVERRENRNNHDNRGGNAGWRTIEQGVSDSLFYLVDTTGRCAVDPDGAAVTATCRNVWYGAERTPGRYHPDDGTWWARALGQMGQPYRYTEHRIEPGDAIYALGNFTTHGGGATRFDKDGAVGDLLREWKRDQAFMLREFDSNGDGQIDMAEWEAARARAEQVVVAENTSNAGPPPVDLLARGTDRRQPFVIAAGTEEAIVRYCNHAAAGLLVVALPLSIGALWALALRIGT